MAEARSREEEINRLFYLQNIYNQQYEAVMSELTTFGMAQTALERNIYLLDNRDRLKDKNILVSAEGGTYIEASVKDVGRVLAYVGAGYMVEKTAADAKEYLAGSLESGRRQVQRLAAEKQRLETELMRIQYAIEAVQSAR